MKDIKKDILWIFMERISIDNMEKKGITGSTLKLIAIVTMLIDHIAAISKGISEIRANKNRRNAYFALFFV